MPPLTPEAERLLAASTRQKASLAQVISTGKLTAEIPCGKSAGPVVAYAIRRLGDRWPGMVWSDREEDARKNLPNESWEVVRVTVEPVEAVRKTVEPAEPPPSATL
jgi:hypothetical protein